MGLKVSFYDRYDVTVPRRIVSVFSILEDIRLGKYKDLVNNVRSYPDDKKKRDSEKKKLPLVGFGGEFQTRNNENLKNPSGLAMLDIDAVGDLSDIIKPIQDDEYTFSSFISPSGNGLKVLVKIPPVSNDSDYKSFYIELQKYYDKYAKTDESTKDISRATFLSYDPKLYLNPESKMFTDRFIVKNIPKKQTGIPVSDMGDVAQKLITWFNKKWTTGQNRNNNLFILSSAFNDYGVDKSVALDYCKSYISNDFKEREIESLVNSAYKKTENFGTKFFEDEAKMKTVQKMVFVGSDKDSIKKRVGDLDGLDKIIDGIESEIDQSIFWEISEKGKIRISFYRFDIYLKEMGISKYFQDAESAQFDFVTKDDNFINWTDPKRIKDIVKRDLLNRGYVDVWDAMASNTSYFSKDYLSMLDTIEIDYKRDDKNTSFIYYKNYAVKTTKKKIELIPYNKLNALVWKKQVIDRDIEIKDESEGIFKTFIWKVSGEDEERYYTLKSVIGYLLHSYQNDAKPKTIIFNDEMLNDDIPNGGSGKGLIHKAISKLKNIVTEDGKKFDPRGQFAYQKVRKDTQVFLLDDVGKNFNFENLFSVVTEGFTVEKKGQDPFKIPFNESPKISITTNYTVKGDGPSFFRRVFEVEIANYFNDKHTPEDEFGHQFFSEWDENEWKRFDNFMIRCIQFFLKNGLVESKKVNLSLRKLKNNVGVEFMEFMEQFDFNDFKYDRKKLRDKFNDEYRNIAKFNTAQKFNRKVKDYCNHFGYEFEERKNGGVVLFEIKGGDIKEKNNNEKTVFDDDF